MLQKIRTVLIPELGLELEPEYLNELEVSTEFSRTLAHIVAQTGSRSIIIKATSDGRLLVASAGTSNEIYAVKKGNAPDIYDGGSTLESDEAIYTTDFLIEAFDATVSFRNAAGDWGHDKALPVGGYSIDLIHYGVKIQNRVGESVSVYEITTYR